MYRGRHRHERPGRSLSRAADVSAVGVLLIATAFGGDATAVADTPVPVTTIVGSAPPVSDPTLPTVGDGCAETPDTGWVCPGQTVEDNTIGPGALPGATDPEAFTVDPVAEAAKDQYAAQTAPTIDEYLALGVNDPVPAEGDIPTSPTPHQPPGGSGPGKSGAVPLGGYSQGSHPWCVPAATATMLTAWGIHPNLASVASAEGSTDEGTPMGNARSYLNKAEKDLYYRFDEAGSAAQVFNHAADDIGGYGAPVMIAVDTRPLKWWAGSAQQGLHVLTIYSYHSQSKGGFGVWDSGFGQESITLANTWTAMEAADAQDAEIW